jgi:CRISPR/Cas system CSM-associated protein Csm3 (group 7 of RAMP superfamily)
VTGPGYGFVPLPPSVRRVARDEARWDRRAQGTLSGCIDLELAAEQPIHVGSGGKHAREGIVVGSGARVRGGPGIPGSSLKGALRARYEAITHSCAGPPPRPWRDGKFKVRSSTKIELARFTRDALDVAALGADGDHCEPGRACPACALFGCMSLRSRITVTDLACAAGGEFEVKSIPERFSPNVHHIGPARIVPFGASDRMFEIDGLHGRKFGLGRGPAGQTSQRFEVIPSGTVLAGQIRLFNVTPIELGGLLSALGCDPPSALKLGGGKAHGYGRVRCKARCRLTGWGKPAPPLDPSVWRRQFMESPDRWSDGEDRLVALHQGGC